MSTISTVFAKGRIRQRLLPLLAVAVTAIVIPAPAQALVINPTFETGLSTAAEAVINTAIGFYESTFSNNATVNIDFHNMASGLGASGSGIVYRVSYETYKAALIANASSANDFIAIANLPANVPGGYIELKPALAQALGIPNTPQTTINYSGFCSFTGDGCIGLNVDLTSTGNSNNPYSLLATVEHEIDEVLGLGSSLLAGNATYPYMSPEDLFRYSSSGHLTYALNATITNQACTNASTAYFSIDGGANALDYFNNCNNGGDYGDWVTHTPSQVQDAFTNGTGSPALTVSSTEVTALDVIGYTLTPVPEPAGVALFGVGFAGLFMARRRALFKKNLSSDSRVAMPV